MKNRYIVKLLINKVMKNKMKKWKRRRNAEGYNRNKKVRRMWRV